MRNVLSKIDILNLLVCRLISKSFCDKLISRFHRKNISTSKEKSRKKKLLNKKVLEIII